MILEDKNTPRIRINIDSGLDELWSDYDNREDASSMLNYHDGNDIQHIKKKMAERFATEITRTKNTVTGGVQYNQVKTREAQVAAIKNNLFEVIVRGMTRKIASNIADLFENSTFSFSINGEPNDEFASDMKEERQRGSFELRASRMDEISVVVGSSAMLTQILDNKENFQPMTPDKIWVVFGSQIKTDDKLRPVDKLNIEDALCVVIQLDTKSFCAYYGRSDMYPAGRFVKYTADYWKDVPKVGDKNATDYMMTENELATMDNIANPLTMHQDNNKVYTSPEYPITTWLGSPVGVGKCLLPVQTGLYESSKEIDLSASRTTMSANKNARGMVFFTDEGGLSSNQPNSIDEGVSKLAEDQSVFVLTVPSSNIDIADQINNNNAMFLGDQWGIPAYRLSNASDSSVPSGEALLELNRPSTKMQQRRKSINDSAMERQFQIELALMSMESDNKVEQNVKQYWEVEPIQMLKTKTELLTEDKLERDMGLTDNQHILVKNNPEIQSTEEAQAHLDSLAVVPVANTTANRFGV